MAEETQNQHEYLYLILGCFGRIDDDFISCAGVENRILKVDESLVHFDDIVQYFDSLRLFDRPLFDINAIRHMLFNMQDKFHQNVRPLWSQKFFRLFEAFTLEHKKCGLYAKLVVEDENKHRVVLDNKENERIVISPKD